LQATGKGRAAASVGGRTIPRTQPPVRLPGPSAQSVLYAAFKIIFSSKAIISNTKRAPYQVARRRVVRGIHDHVVPPHQLRRVGRGDAQQVRLHDHARVEGGAGCGGGEGFVSPHGILAVDDLAVEVAELDCREGGGGGGRAKEVERWRGGEVKR
jgi:hypothetical protein